MRRYGPIQDLEHTSSHSDMGHPARRWLFLDAIPELGLEEGDWLFYCPEATKGRRETGANPWPSPFAVMYGNESTYSYFPSVELALWLLSTAGVPFFFDPEFLCLDEASIPAEFPAEEAKKVAGARFHSRMEERLELRLIRCGAEESPEVAERELDERIRAQERSLAWFSAQEEGLQEEIRQDAAERARRVAEKAPPHPLLKDLSLLAAIEARRTTGRTLSEEDQNHV